jgi:hypothetical protein
VDFKSFERAVFGKSSVGSGSAAPAGTEPPALISTSPVQEPKWNGRWRRFLRLAASQAISGYAPVLVPASVLNLFGVEDYYPDEVPYWAATNGAVPAGAAVISMFGLFNPRNSGILAIVSYVSAFATAAATIVLSTDPTFMFTGFTTTANGFPRDSRAPWSGTSSIAQFVTDNAHGIASNGPVGIKPAAAATSLVEWTGSGETGFAVVAPGHALVVSPSVVNIGITGEMRWRERAFPNT